MIVVIADDFTGAAEMAGIGLRQGLKTELRMEVPDRAAAELLVIAADTRSKDVGAAVADMREISFLVRKLEPELVYKKIDSVLRGHVVAELRAQMEVLGFSRALLVPANPVLGRVVSGGHYFVNGVPVNETAFAVDPEFPVRSSDVREMLGEGFAESGIVVGEASGVDDLRVLAGRAEPGVLLAGAGGFFAAILERRRLPVLYVSGTKFKNNRGDGPVLYMPVAVDEVVRVLREEGRAMVVERTEPGNAPELRTEMARVIGEVLSRVKLGELVIEGGSTAFAILKRAGFSGFVPLQELAQGVVRLRTPGGMLVTVKPGSYPWPESLRY